MNTDDVKEWLEIADNDLDSALLLNDAPRKHFEIICYHCAQAAEKYLKAYLISKDIIPQKTHDLRFLNNLCIGFEKEFESCCWVLRSSPASAFAFLVPSFHRFISSVLCLNIG